MASLHKRPKSKFWSACFTGRDGVRHKISTKTVDRRQAQKIADQFEEAYRSMKTAEQVEKVIRQAHEEATGEKLTVVSIADYVQRWQARKKGEGVSVASLKFYNYCTGNFVTWLGAGASRPISSVTRADIERFRDALAEKHAAKTVGHQIKGIRMLFKAAREDLGIENPTEFVKATGAKRKAAAGRKAAFTAAGIRGILAHVTGEWRTLTLLGAYTGGRLADLQHLTWESVDAKAGIIAYVSRKTGRQMRTPIAAPLASHLAGIRAESGPILPRLIAKKSNTLSGEFTNFLRACGLREDKEGEVTDRLGLSFHSLRHALVSLLKEAGVSASVAMEFAGHDSAQMSQHYTTVSDESMRSAAASLPDLL